MTSYAEDLRSWLDGQDLSGFSTRGRTLADDVARQRPLLRLLYEDGWSRRGWPVEAGGLGGPVTLRAVLYDELASRGVELPEAFVILETLGPALVAFAPALARVHLPRYLAGDELWGQGFSEPEAGSDLGAVGTRATVVPDGFVLDGQKTWTTLGQFAAYAAVLARTGAVESRHRGLSLLWVDLAAPGVTVRPIRAANGRDEFAELFFSNVAVPRDALIGELNGGWAVAMYLLQYERGMYAWLRQAVLHHRLAGLADEASPRSPDAVAALGEAYLAVTALRARSRATVAKLSAGENPGPAISIDKILLAQAEQATFDAARRLRWPAMAIEERGQALREEWFYSRASSIFGGAIDIQRDLVAEHVLALPRGRR